eukprot:6512555-Pyramimonas_sp.AAC.1
MCIRDRSGPWSPPSGKYPGKVPGHSQQTQVRDGFPPGRGLPRSPERAKRAPTGFQDGPRGFRITEPSQDAQHGLKTGQEASK